MAKSRSGRRASFHSKSTSSPAGLPSVFQSTPVNLSLFEDRRLWHPLGRFRPATAIPRAAARIVPKPVKKAYRKAKRIPARLAFAAPDRVVICLRRKIRKEVLHAKALAGTRGRKKRPTRNYWSAVSCR